MSTAYILIFVFIRNIFGEIPAFDFSKSTEDLLAKSNPYTYTIDERDGWYNSADRLKKTIKKDGNTITHQNYFNMYKAKFDGDKEYDGNVKWESVESFYLDIDNKANTPLVCPRGNYDPIKVWMSAGQYITTCNDCNMPYNANRDLKCFYHRQGAFLVYYLNNGENYIYELNYENRSFKKKYKLNDDIKEL